MARRAKGQGAAQKPRGRATLREVAELSGVSVMTVSNVVNAKFALVGEDTRRKVEQAIEQTHYRPIASSRSLRSAVEYSVGMIITDEAPAFLADPFITELVAGLSNYLSSNDYSLSIQAVKPQSLESAPLFKSVSTDALCVLLCGEAATRRQGIAYLQKLRQPLIVFQETEEIPDADVAVVNQDDFEGGQMLASQLLSRGARSLLFLRPSTEWPAMNERERGVRAACDEAPEDIMLAVLECRNEEFEQTQAALRAYLAKNGAPDAVLGGNDRLGLAALRCLQDQGFKVPQDIMITGFNGFESCQYCNPPLTTVTSPAYEMGQYSGHLILQRLKQGKFSKRRTLFPVRFQSGGSA